MANQDPQPEIYRVASTFVDSTVVNTDVVTNIVTTQANNEEVRIYAMQVDITDDDSAAINPATAADCDFTVTIQVGANNVPSQPIRIRPIWVSNTKTLTFPSPIIVLFQQPFRVTVTNNQAQGATDGRIVTLNFIGELAIQKVACETLPFNNGGGNYYG